MIDFKTALDEFDNGITMLKRRLENEPDADGSVDLCKEDGQIARATLKQFREGV